VDFLLFLSVASFHFLSQTTTDYMRTFLYWFYMKYPHWLKKGHPFTPLMLAMKQMNKNISKREYYMMRHGADYL
jgi:hypothetical protein